MSIASVEEGIEEIRVAGWSFSSTRMHPKATAFFVSQRKRSTLKASIICSIMVAALFIVTLTDERIRELSIPMVPEENSRLGGLLLRCLVFC